MSTTDFSAMTVVELRKYAKEHGVTLGAGLNKSDIIQKLEEAEPQETASSAPAAPEEAPKTAPAIPEEAPKPAPESQPAFRSAWRNPSNRYTGSLSRTYQAAPPQPRPAQAPVAPRPAPRFGPGAAVEPKPQEEPRPAQPVWAEPAPLRREPAPAPMPAPAPISAPAPVPSTVPAAAPQPVQEAEPTAQELMTPATLQDVSGVLEMHPDGYAFLRTVGMIPSAGDVYVAAAQIKRFGLRTGDLVLGKARPQREGDKFKALLTVTRVNNRAPEEIQNRPSFDALTAIYPQKPVSLKPADPRRRSTRLLELVAPIGFGQRVLLLCQPESGKTCLMRNLANAINANHPDATVYVLLLDENPEDVTLFRDAVSCEVFATTFDQNPENHLRLSELLLERAERQAEAGGDVVVLVDSLTRLSKAYTLAAAQQGRATPGMINPASLYRAKRLFGAARALREGGSLTVVGCLNVATGNKVDDTIIEEFREAANCVITLDAGLARAGMRPAISFHQSGTRRVESFVNPTQLEGLRILRKELGGLSDGAALKQLSELMELVPDNETLFARLPEWIALLDGKK